MTEKPDIRRSLTITGENDTRILNNRACFMGKKDIPIDVDYTTMVNMCIEIADLILQKRDCAEDIGCGLTLTTDSDCDMKVQIDTIIAKYTT